MNGHDRVLDEADNAEVYQFVGKRLRELRKARGMTQVEVAKSINISPQQYQKYEDAQSKCSLGKLIKLAGFFAEPLESLLPMDGAMSSSSVVSDMTTEADLLARLVGAYVKLRTLDEKLRLVQLVEAIVASQDGD